MSFKMKYQIIKDYLPHYPGVHMQRRQGNKLEKPLFGVVHDTGNSDSTAKGNITYYKNTIKSDFAAAHLFVDDKEIRECIPYLTGTPEKANHVIYNVTTDNQMFGDDANDVAPGVEYCYGPNINAEEAYKRYVWVCAYCSYKGGFSPEKWVGHFILDPKRKVDPKNGLSKSCRTYEQLLKDIVDEYNECLEFDSPKKPAVKAAVSTKPFYSLPGGVLKAGNKNALETVKQLQTALKAAGFDPGAVDGKFGPNTTKQLKAFQKTYKLTADGVYGPKTKAKLKEVLS